MNLRNLNIGSRLGLGFGLILLASGAMLANALLAGAHNREAILQTLQAAGQRQADASDMERALLASSVAVRNMGLQTAVDGGQKSEAEAKKERAAYLAARKRLEANELSVDERAPLERLVAIDRQMDDHFKETVDLAATFNSEQAGALITQKIDPLLNGALAELVNFSTLQKQRSQVARDAADAAAAVTQRATVGAAIAVLAVSMWLAWRLTISITRPLRTAEQAASRVAAGELDFDIDGHGHDEAARLLAALDAMRGSLAAVVDKVRRNSHSVAAASSEIAQGNNDLSARTERQASALEETAASMEQLGTAVRHNADNARQANQLAMGATTVAVKGGDVVSQVVTTMKGINDSSKKIADIIGVIDGIAFQTNILALNAAVEAARAGEQGRGFAVVASEVRNLAGRSADAAKEIKSLINASVERVEQGTSLVGQAGTTMTEVVTAIQRVADIMGEISSASAQQSAGVAQVGQAVSQMDQATQQNAALVEQSAAAAESLKVQAQQLVQAMAMFKLAQTASSPPSTSAPASVAAASRASAGAPARAAGPVPASSSSVPSAARPALEAGVPVSGLQERRGPNRAKNVVRPPFGRPAAPAGEQDAAPGVASAGSDEWASF